MQKREKNLNEISYRLARLISDIFIPPSLLLITYITLAFNLETSTFKSALVIFVAAVFGFILPIAAFIIMLKKGKIIDQDATIKEERTFPFMVGIAIQLAGLIFLFLYQINHFTISFWISYIVNTFVIIIINKFWKISVHAFGVSAPMAALFLVLPEASIILIPVLALVCWSRLRLKVHTLAQIVTGAVVGFVLTFFQITIISRVLYVP